MPTIDSWGGVRSLTRQVAELYAQVGAFNFSMIVAAKFDGTTPVEARALVEARAHP